MRTCKACGQIHSALLSCSRAARLAARNAPPVVVHTAPVVVHAPDGSPQSRHGVYADPAARKAYKRDWMRRKRAGQPSTSPLSGELVTLT